MSRIGRAPITVPAGVEINIADNNVVTVKGPKGSLTQQFNANMAIAIAEKVVGRELNAADQSKLVDDFINELGDQV